MTNAALAGYRKARATEMALAGGDDDTIAKELGYANRSGAWKAVQRSLAQLTDKAVDAYRREQVILFDAVMSAQWEGAVAGKRSSCPGCAANDRAASEAIGFGRHLSENQRGNADECVLLSSTLNGGGHQAPDPWSPLSPRSSVGAR